MVVRRSPGGSIFPYDFKGGVLFGLHFGSFFEDEDRLLDLMKAEEEFMATAILRRFPLWIDFYETRLTDRVLTEFSSCILRLSSRLIKLAVVGCSRKDQRRIRQRANQNWTGICLPLRFFNDPEVAKTWLVSESA